ncbi:glutathione S-transferase family protein [Archangium minus]|uniref:Glutathione S-transferase family protein n=1 Tax=Archangium minus TaxID=83450 RepID=A0ABY9WGK5_9BACT|nr:glutathione S-transferase family protein [Archangium minus]
MITVTAFRWVPPFAQGLVRDHRVRWALEEVGLPYQEKLISVGPEDQASEAYRRLQPFGQVPVYEEDGLTLFESGAIVLHIAEKSEVLMPREPAARARAITWMFAALNSIEPHIQNFTAIDIFFANEEWAKLRRPSALQMAEKRLDELATWMKGREWLEDRFTAGDLLMVSVLRILRHTNLVAARPELEAYRQRGEARPAFQKALADQLAPFAKYAPPRT